MRVFGNQVIAVYFRVYWYPCFMLRRSVFGVVLFLVRSSPRARSSAVTQPRIPHLPRARFPRVSQKPTLTSQPRISSPPSSRCLPKLPPTSPPTSQRAAKPSSRLSKRPRAAAPRPLSPPTNLHPGATPSSSPPSFINSASAPTCPSRTSTPSPTPTSSPSSRAPLSRSSLCSLSPPATSRTALPRTPAGRNTARMANPRIRCGSSKQSATPAG